MNSNPRPTLYFAPDGFTAPRAPRAEAGLKHAVAAAVSGRYSQRRDANAAEGTADDHTRFLNQDGYDEGIVHSHGWARN